MKGKGEGSGRFEVGLVLNFIHCRGRDLKKITRFADRKGEIKNEMVREDEERATEVRFQRFLTFSSTSR